MSRASHVTLRGYPDVKGYPVMQGDCISRMLRCILMNQVYCQQLPEYKWYSVADQRSPLFFFFFF
jgi:hypothetical protein